VKVDTDAAQALAARLDIRGIPTFAIFEQGREVARVAGAMNLARFVEWVRANV
jgi:thioredoxin 2